MSTVNPVVSSVSSTNANTNRVIDYWPSWTDWSRNSLKEYLPNGSKSRVDVINICFAIPQTDGALKWTDARTDSEDPTKSYIQALRKAGKKVLISVGGASDQGGPIEWNIDKPGIAAKLASNIKQFINDYDLDGVDIDYERLEQGPRKSIPAFIEILRKALPNHIITYAAFSVGAYSSENKPHAHAEWIYSEEYGIEVDILKKAGNLLDWVNVMSYDVFAPDVTPSYNPTEAIEAYRALMGAANKVVLGIELGYHSWPSNVRTSTNVVQPWIEYAAKNNFGGVMFWTLTFDTPDYTGEKAGAFLELTSKIMPKAGVETKDPQDQNSQTESKDNKDSKDGKDQSSSGDTKTTTEGLPDLTGISAENQAKIKEIFRKQQEQLKNLENQQLEIRKIRNEALKTATPSQQKTLKEQFKVNDAQLDANLQAVKKSLQDQLAYVIFQYRSSAAVTGKQPVSTETKTTDEPKQTESFSADLTGISTENQDKIKEVFRKQQEQLKTLERQHLEIRNKRNEALKTATPTQQETLEEQFNENDKQLDTQYQAVKKSLQDQLENMISQYRPRKLSNIT